MFAALDSEVAAKSLFVHATAPMLGAARQVRMKPLAEPLFAYMLDTYQQQVRVDLDRAEMQEAWEKLGRSPRYLRALLEDMSQDRATSPWACFDEIHAAYCASDDWSEFHSRRTPLERMIIEAIAQGRDAAAPAIRRDFAEQLDKSSLSASTIHRVLGRLQVGGVVHSEDQRLCVTNPAYRNWIAARSVHDMSHGRHSDNCPLAPMQLSCEMPG